jgi:hypothetical protein
LEQESGAPLLLPPYPEEIMPEQANTPNPNEKLVKVFDSEQETEVMVVKGLLESAGIESDMTSVDAVQDLFPGVGGTVLLVREEDAAEAQRIIEANRNAPIDDETAEISGEPGPM